MRNNVGTMSWMRNNVGTMSRMRNNIAQWNLQSRIPISNNKRQARRLQNISTNAHWSHV